MHKLKLLRLRTIKKRLTVDLMLSKFSEAQIQETVPHNGYNWEIVVFAVFILTCGILRNRWRFVSLEPVWRLLAGNACTGGTKRNKNLLQGKYKQFRDKLPTMHLWERVTRMERVFSPKISRKRFFNPINDGNWR